MASAADIRQAKRQALLAGSYADLKNVLEDSVVDAAMRGDSADFDSTYAQLESLYLDQSAARLEFNEQERLCLGLGLMKYLKDDDMASFHVLLQHVRYMLGDSTTLREAVRAPAWSMLSYPLDIERELVNGNLSGVLESTRHLNRLPHPAFSYFMKALEASIKERVCTAIESAYQKLPIAVAIRLLGLENEAELLQFIENKMSEVWEQTLNQPSAMTFGSLATPQHSASDRAKVNDFGVMVGLARTSSLTHKTLLHKMTSGRAPAEETLVFENKEPPKLWTVTPDHKYVEILNASAARTYIPSTDLLKTWLNLTENLENV